MRGLEHYFRRCRTDLGARPAHHSRQGDRAGLVGDHHVLRMEFSGDVVERGQPLTRACAPDADPSGQLGPVESVQGLPGLQHHVVGDVHGKRDGAHSALPQPMHHPVRCRGARIEPRYRSYRESVAAGRVVDMDLVCAAVGQRHRRGDVAERDAERGRCLPGQSSDRQAVPAIGRHRDVENDVAQAQQVKRIIAGLHRIRWQHEDPGVVVADAQLALRADHAVRNVAVRPARGDREIAGQHRPRQRRDNQVAHGEVVRTADDATQVRRADVDLAPADDLAVLLWLVLERHHAAGDDRTGQSLGPEVDVLDLHPDAQQSIGEPARRETRR